jgi:hypothetical protein
MAAELAEPTVIDSAESVIALLSEDLGESGFHRALDDQHEAVFISRGPKLLVIFQNFEDAVRDARLGGPVGLDFVEDKNYSLLYLGARTKTWFRAQSVFEFFDTLVDDCFFEDFDQVIFYGTGIGAYAACAYSVASPGARVLAIAPQATLDMDRTGWDKRFPKGRVLDFNSRYGYAPDMLEGAAQAHILFDPFSPLDYVHASLFHGPNIALFKCRHFDGQIESALREMDILHRIIEACADGQLTHECFFRVLRARRDHTRYLRTLLYSLDRKGKTLRVAFLCKAVLARRGGPVFRKSLAVAEKRLHDLGQRPSWLRDPDARPFTTETSPPPEDA